MAGSVSNYWEPSYQWTEYCFQKAILESGIRAWSVHPYGVRTPEEFAVGHTRTRELLVQYGAPDMPMLNTERGFSVEKRDEGWSGGSEQRAREFQAWHVVRQAIVDQLHDVRATVWYEWDPNPHYDSFALVDADGTPRPSGQAAQVMMQQLDGLQLQRRVRTENDLDYVVLFADDAGNQKLVAWTAPSPGDTPDAAGEHEIEIALGTAGGVEVVDVFGEGRNVDADNDTLRLTISGSPQYVSLPSNASVGEWTTPAAESAHRDFRRDLELFGDAAAWTFLENTGQGAFTVDVDDDGTPIGIMAYDFTGSQSQATPYVLATVPVEIEEGFRQLNLAVRTPVAQQLTFRVTDSTGQTHQYKTTTRGTDQWETVSIPLTERLEHWGGAADGSIHFPIESIVFSLPLPDEDHPTGEVTYANVRAVTR